MCAEMSAGPIRQRQNVAGEQKASDTATDHNEHAANVAQFRYRMERWRYARSAETIKLVLNALQDTTTLIPVIHGIIAEYSIVPGSSSPFRKCPGRRPEARQLLMQSCIFDLACILY